MNERNENIELLYIDLFCGAGGTSTGVERAMANGKKCAKVIACVNHDPNAIASHAANHPHALHFTEDIRTLDLTRLIEHVVKMRKKYPKALLVLWASLECTNFSKAKGGQPRDADSRTLAEHLFRYVEAVDPDYIYIENVEEFMSWGDIDRNGKPISKDKGRLYLRWVRNMCGYGYEFSHKMLNAADYGAYTSRTRFFGIFAKRGLPIVYPQPTHCKEGKKDMFGMIKQWNAVREVLDLQDEGESIFARKKPLCEKTLERIYAGLVKFIAGGKEKHEEFMLRYNSVRPKDTVKSLNEPCGVLTVENRFAKVKCQFLSKHFSGDPNSKNTSIDKPAGTLTCKCNQSFVTAFYGNGFNRSIEEPAPTQTKKDRFAIVTTQFYANEFSGGGQLSSIERPNPALLAIPKQKLISVRQYLANPFSFKSDGSSIDKPCFTLIARMDKMPPYLITTKEGVGIAIFDSDSPMTVQIKEFMAIYGIIDICMRMLKVDELKRITGFPSDYILIGTQSEQKKYIGNAVEVNMSRVLCEALCGELQMMKKTA